MDQGLRLMKEGRHGEVRDPAAARLQRARRAAGDRTERPLVFRWS
jgi:hypothetical protein